MANERLYLFIALCVVGLLLFQAWQKDYAPKPLVAQQPAATTPAAKGKTPPPTKPTAEVPVDVPTVPVAKPAPGAPAVAGEARKLPSGQRIHVRTDDLDVALDTIGGDVRQVDLPKYTVSVKDRTPYRIMSDRGSKLYVAQSGFSMAAGEGPDHRTTYTAEHTDYRMAPGQDTLRVNLHWSGAGIKVTKTFVFHRGSYVIGVEYRVDNGSAGPWKGSFYRHLQRTYNAKTSGKSRFVHTYTGAAIYTPEHHYKKISFSDMQEKNLDVRNVSGGWVAMLQHYFVAAWIPAAHSTDTFYSLYRPQPFHSYYIGMKSPVVTIPPGGEKLFDSEIYVGPKLQGHLAAVSPGLDLTVDYGLLTVISKPLFWMLSKFHKVLGNWGWSIILLTVLIKLVFYKLSETSYRSMANMRRVQPRMKALKERYGDDRKKVQQGMMELYKTEKINPLGGCLPIVVQIPVFIALYYMLLESVEMRQAPFILWIHDLASPDPYYVLPLLMGVTMFLQQKLNPAQIDPLQQKIMMALPLVFTVFFMFFPAGLVLYWVVNNTLSIAQQWIITKRIVGAAGAK